MKNQMIAVAVIVGVVALGTGFLAGTKYQQGKQSGLRLNRQFDANGAGMKFQANGNRAGIGFRPVEGEIIASDDKSITVKLTDGSSKIVLISNKTSINKTETGSKSDLTTQTKVAVFGQENSDGSVSATNIQINPLQRNLGANPSPMPQGK